MTPAELLLARKAHGMSLADMSQHLGVDERTIRRWENGEFPIPLGVAAEVETVPDIIDQAAERFAQAWETAKSMGIESLPMPEHPADLPEDQAHLPMPIIHAALWQARLKSNIPVTRKEKK